MGRMYTASFENVAVAAVQDLFELVAPADAIVVMHYARFTQNTETGDAEEEMLRVVLKSGHTTSGSVGTTVTPVPIELGDAAFGGTCEANNTTQASVGTIVTHHAWNWNIRSDLIEIWTPEMRPILSPSRRLVFDLEAAPADSVTMSGTIGFEEIGG